MINDPHRDTAPIGHGDPVAAARDIETTQGLYIPQGMKAPSPRTADPPSWSSSTTRHAPSNIDEQDLRGLAG